MNDVPTLLTVPQAAHHLSVSVRTLRAILAAGHLPVIRISARRIAIDKSDLIEFIEQRRTRPRKR
jgi:excisionase family DNA binding protein